MITIRAPSAPIRATVGLFSAFSLAVAPRADACSKASFYTGRNPRTAHFVGVASSDTVLAGAGTVTYHTERGHFGPGTPRVIYGQVMEVERLGTTVPTRLRDLLGAGRVRVILVPWDYAPDCHPVVWSQSVRWVQPGTRGLFSAMLRDSAHWVNGVPTLDVHEPYSTPHPSNFGLRRARLGRPSSGGASDSVLTPEQLLDLYDLLPEGSAMKSNPDSATAPLRQWMREHPDLAARPPADYILRLVLGQAETARVKAIESPLAGTYRFVLRLSSSDSVAVFARTTRYPITALRSATPNYDRRPTPIEPTLAVGYSLMAQVASAGEELPAEILWGQLGRQGYVTALMAPHFTTPDSTVWQGSVDLLRPATQLAPAGPLREQLEAAQATMWELLRSRELTFVPGYFVKRADGSIRFTLDVVRNGAQVLSIRGERIALDYLQER